jgi:hypothetical protein
VRTSTIVARPAPEVAPLADPAAPTLMTGAGSLRYRIAGHGSLVRL